MDQPVVGSTFRNTVILLDGAQFIDCRFINCTINFGGKLDGMLLRDCEFHECIWGFVDGTRDTFSYLALLYSGLGTGNQDMREIVEDVFDSIRRQGLEIVQAHARDASHTGTEAGEHVAVSGK